MGVPPKNRTPPAQPGYGAQSPPLADTIMGGLATAAGPTLGVLVPGFARAVPNLVGPLGRGDMVAADGVIQRGIGEQQRLRDQFVRAHPIVGAAITAPSPNLLAASLQSPVTAAAVRAGASGVRQVAGVQRGYGANASDRLPYQEQTFRGGKQMVDVGRPPTNTSLAPGQEYGVELKDVAFVDGHPQGRAVSQWRGQADEVSLANPDTIHGEHDGLKLTPNGVGLTTLNPGGSRFDRQNVDQSIVAGQTPKIAGVRHKEGFTAYITTAEALEKIPQYILDAEPVAREGQRYYRGDENTPPDNHRYVQNLYEFFLDDDGNPISRAAAEDRIRAYQEARPEIYAPKRESAGSR